MEPKHFDQWLKSKTLSKRGRRKLEGMFYMQYNYRHNTL